MLKNVRVLDSTGSNNSLISKKKTTSSLNTGTYQSTSFTSALSNSITSAVNTVTKAQNATVSKVSSLTSSSSKSTTKTSTSTKTPVVTKVDYSSEIQKVKDAITRFNNADTYLKKALDYLSSGLIINGSNPFSSTVNSVKTSNLTELSKLTNEILPEMK